MNIENYTHLAVCPYCGQAMQVELPVEFPSREELDAAAIRNCNCYEAGRRVEKEKRLMDAKDTIEAMYGMDEDAELRELILQVVSMIVYEKIESAKVNIGYRRSISIREKNGRVQITETQRQSITEEV